MTVDWNKVAKQNEMNLKKVASGGKIAYEFGRLGSNHYVVLVGTSAAHHLQPELGQIFRGPGVEKGTIEVLREPLRGKGEIRVSGLNNHKAQFEAEMAKITKKKLFYV